jgi:hypothetical protein
METFLIGNVSMLDPETPNFKTMLQEISLANGNLSCAGKMSQEDSRITQAPEPAEFKP